MMIATFATVTLMLERIATYNPWESPERYELSLVKQILTLSRAAYATRHPDGYRCATSRAWALELGISVKLLTRLPETIARELLCVLRDPIGPCKVASLVGDFTRAFNLTPRCHARWREVDVENTSGYFLFIWQKASYAIRAGGSGLLWGDTDASRTLRSSEPCRLIHPRSRVEFLEMIHMFITYLVDLGAVDYLMIVSFFHYLIFSNFSEYGRHWQFTYCLLLTCLGEMEEDYQMSWSDFLRVPLHESDGVLSFRYHFAAKLVPRYFPDGTFNPSSRTDILACASERCDHFCHSRPIDGRGSRSAPRLVREPIVRSSSDPGRLPRRTLSCAICLAADNPAGRRETLNISNIAVTSVNTTPTVNAPTRRVTTVTANPTLPATEEVFTYTVAPHVRRKGCNGT